MNILDKIVAQKKIEVEVAKAKNTIKSLEQSTLFSKKGLSLKSALETNPFAGIIAEFKRKSPSKGTINGNVEPEVVTKGYVDAGATGLSVLTDADFFGGSFDDFLAARTACPTIPMLRKDFMIDEYQLWEAKALGADVILLIAACLTTKEVQYLAWRAHELDLEVLLEVHNEQELENTLSQHIDMVGVNNRNLKTFETTIDTSLHLASLIPDNFVKISESGLQDVSTINQLQKVGYKGFLIGETFMKTPNPAQALKDLIYNLHNINT